jgi:hypothetical protein
VSAGEVVGLSLTVALFAFLAGVILGTSRDRRDSSPARDRAERNAVLSRFLSARRAATRASLTFVAAFRALAGTEEASVHRRMRVGEAHASRRRLRDALDRLNRAEADVIVWFPDRERTDQRNGSLDVATMRAAIDGTDSDVATLQKRLRDADRLAATRVRAWAKTSGDPPRQLIAGDFVGTIRSALDRLRRGS